MGGAKKIEPDQIVVGDCTEVMRSMAEASVDMVFRRPAVQPAAHRHPAAPQQHPVDGVDDDWDRFDGFAAYDRFSRDWLAAARRVLKPDGTLWVIGTYHNIYRVGAILQDLGFWILNDVVWRKTNPMPNFRGRRFTNAHEILLWCAPRRESRYRFNYEAMKALNDDVQMRSDWLLPLCTGRERLKVDGRKAHPTQKPEALLHRVILASTEVGEVVLDPFFGSGTTGAVAKRLGRHYIGIEAEAGYAALAEARLAAVTAPADPGLMSTPAKRSQPRIPFGWLVERGIIAPGTVLCDQRRRHTARVRADGSLVTADFRGSIHPDRGLRAEGAGLQRLAVLVHRQRRRAGLHRRAAPKAAGGAELGHALMDGGCLSRCLLTAPNQRTAMNSTKFPFGTRGGKRAASV